MEWTSGFLEITERSSANLDEMNFTCTFGSGAHSLTLDGHHVSECTIVRVSYFDGIVRIASCKWYLLSRA